MLISEVTKLIAVGAIKPEAEIAVELGFPPVKITLKLKAGDIQKLMLNERVVSDTLRRCFTQRRVLWFPIENEGRNYCIDSVNEITQELCKVQDELDSAGKNAALVELLARWEDISVTARQELQGTAALSDVLRRYRVKSLPIVESLIAFLSTSSLVRTEAEKKTKEARRSLPGPDLALVSDAWRLTDIH
jgi:hypothetical protein